MAYRYISCSIARRFGPHVCKGEILLSTYNGHLQLRNPLLSWYCRYIIVNLFFYCVIYWCHYGALFKKGDRVLFGFSKPSDRSCNLSLLHLYRKHNKSSILIKTTWRRHTRETVWWVLVTSTSWCTHHFICTHSSQIILELGENTYDILLLKKPVSVKHLRQLCVVVNKTERLQWMLSSGFWC